jgi:hypothetical protein
MSDFPRGGDVQDTRAWLDKEGFAGMFTDWKADAILGQDKSDILKMLGTDNGLKLWGFLNIARSANLGKFFILCLSVLYFNVTLVLLFFSFFASYQYPVSTTLAQHGSAVPIP